MINPDVLSYVDEEDALMGVLQHKGAEHEQAILNSVLDRRGSRGVRKGTLSKNP